MVEVLRDVVVSALAVAIQLGLPVTILFVCGYLGYRTAQRGQGKERRR